MKRHVRPLALLIVVACGHALSEPGWAASGQATPYPTVNPWTTGPKVIADSLLRTLTVREKVGQLIMPWLIGAYEPLEGDAFDSAAAWVEQHGVGGIIISIGSPLDAAAKLNALQRRAQIPLIVAADLEYGAGMRMIGATAFPQPMAIGATGRELDAYQLGRITAIEARAVGIHWTFSPVADINNNPDNPIINTRSFGEDPYTVATLLGAYIRGASDHGLYTTAKHFPGHGDTGVDSHLELPVLEACWQRLNSLELVPFRAAIAAGVTSVMTAHIALPCVDGSGTPATLSNRVMTDILRDSLGFDGIVVTDALTMGAIVRQYGVGASAVQALQAGSDMLLMPTDIPTAIDAVVAAVDSGLISRTRLDSSVVRVLMLKEHAGLFARREVPLDSIPATVGRRAHQLIADDVAARALTLVQEGPIQQFRERHERTAVITYAEESNLSIGNELIRTVRRLGGSIEPFRIYPASGPMSYDSAQAVIGRARRVVFAISVRPIASRGHIDLPQALAQLIASTDDDKPTVLASFGSPYLINQIPGFSGSYLIGWHQVGAVERAVANALANGAAITGQLPISVSELFPRGYGVELPAR